jgi:hypothetical protein
VAARGKARSSSSVPSHEEGVNMWPPCVANLRDSGTHTQDGGENDTGAQLRHSLRYSVTVASSELSASNLV